MERRRMFTVYFTARWRDGGMFTVYYPRQIERWRDVYSVLSPPDGEKEGCLQCIIPARWTAWGGDLCNVWVMASPSFVCHWKQMFNFRLYCCSFAPPSFFKETVYSSCWFWFVECKTLFKIFFWSKATEKIQHLYNL
jgi:hypothetical protein